MRLVDSFNANEKWLFSMQEDAIVEKIGYPEVCVNKTLLEEYYYGVSTKTTV